MSVTPTITRILYIPHRKPSKQPINTYYLVKTRPASDVLPHNVNYETYNRIILERVSRQNSTSRIHRVHRRQPLVFHRRLITVPHCTTHRSPPVGKGHRSTINKIRRDKTINIYSVKNSYRERVMAHVE